jgi:hypothetical protein
LIDRNAEDYMITPTEESKTISYSVSRFGVSAGIFYPLKNDKLSHKIGVGIQYSGAITNHDESSTKYHSSIDYRIMYRLEYGIANNLSLFVQPYYTHGLKNERIVNQPFTLKPYYVGVGVGAVLKF